MPLASGCAHASTFFGQDSNIVVWVVSGSSSSQMHRRGWAFQKHIFSWTRQIQRYWYRYSRPVKLNDSCSIRVKGLDLS